jgi:hypothetical protein
MTKDEAKKIKADYEDGLKVREANIRLLEKLLDTAKLEMCTFKADNAYDVVRAAHALGEDANEVRKAAVGD